MPWVFVDHTESREHITSGGSHTLPNIELRQYTDGTLEAFDSATSDSFLFLTALGWPPAAVTVVALGWPPAAVTVLALG